MWQGKEAGQPLITFEVRELYLNQLADPPLTLQDLLPEPPDPVSPAAAPAAPVAPETRREP